MIFDASPLLTKRLCFWAMGPEGPGSAPEADAPQTPEVQADVQQLQAERTAEKQAVQTDTADQLQTLAQTVPVAAEAQAASPETAETAEGAAETEPGFDTAKLDAVDRVLEGPADTLFNNPGYDETNIASLQAVVLESAKRPSPIDAWGRQNGLDGALDANRQATVDQLHEGGFL